MTLGRGHSQGVRLPEVSQGKFLHAVVVGVRGQRGVGHKGGQAGGLRVVTLCLALGTGRVLGAQKIRYYPSAHKPEALPQHHSQFHPYLLQTQEE